MDISFTPEQEAFCKAVRGFLAAHCDRTVVRQLEAGDLGYSQDHWRAMAQMGWLGLAFPAAYGGQGKGFTELAILLEEFGRHPFPTPYQNAALQSALAILHLGSESQKKAHLSKLFDGSSRYAFCLTEASASYDPWGVNVRAIMRGPEYAINGAKLFIQYGASADHYIVVARTRDTEDHADGITVFLVEANAKGITKTPLKSMADDKQCEIVFNQVMVSRQNILGTLHKAWPALQKVITLSTIAASAELAGCARAALEHAVDYAKHRVQFGKPIGSFQAVQHYAADMLTAADAATLAVYDAASRVDQGLSHVIEASQAKAVSSDAALRVTAKGHQIMGGIGVYKERDMQLWYRRAKVMEQLFGDAQYHREKVAQLMML
ncbi:MAG: acyl-CoA dehydrogenase [Chloroflexi bacterium]|nr:acyl-CoA dehydrogenase [Chloroflexota bacterium]